MQKNLQAKILLSLLAAGSIGILGFTNYALADEITGNDTNGVLDITEGTYTSVTGWNTVSESEEGYVEISGANVTIGGTTEITDTLSGGNAIKADVTKVHDNIININGNAVVERAYGGDGRKSFADSYNNILTVTDNAKTNELGGGTSQKDPNSSTHPNVYNNKVYLNGYATANNVSGGGGLNVNVYDNEVIISGNATVEGTGDITQHAHSGGVFGGGSDGENLTNEVYNNIVTFKDNAKLEKGIIWGGNGNAYHNTVNIEGNPTINGNVYGGGSFYAYNIHDNKVNISGGTFTETSNRIAGGYTIHGNAYNNMVNINGGTFEKNANANASNMIAGGYTEDGNAYDNKVNINGGTINVKVSGGYSSNGDVYNNTVIISGGTLTSGVYAAYNDGAYETKKTDNNKIILTGSANVSEASLYGNLGRIDGKRDITNNKLIVDGWSGRVKDLYNFNGIDFENISLEEENSYFYSNSIQLPDDFKININSVAAGDYDYTNPKPIDVTLTLGKNIATKKPNSWPFTPTDREITIADKLNPGENTESVYFASDNGDNGVIANKFSSLSAQKIADDDVGNKRIKISATVSDTILAGKFINADGTPTINNNGDASLTIGKDFSTNARVVAGAYAVASTKGTQNAASGGKVYIEGDYDGIIYAGFSEDGTTSDNTIYIGGSTNAASLKLLGDNKTSGTSGAALTVTGNGSALESIGRFDTITFKDVELNKAAALTVASADLTGTSLTVNSLAGGQQYKLGDSVNLLSSANKIEGTAKNISTGPITIPAGLAQQLTLSTAQTDNNISLTVMSVGLTPQANMLVENHAASAAFLNQGTDLINDSLDVLGRDGTYGVKTFAAVQGNRSSYDVADDLKINGWSVIAGFGAENEHKGGDFAWGVFYENGSGNYRTYNTFNNEFFRGDGSMVYNGGGIAARYENAKGVYTEGSLRAGMLKNEMDNALRDASGASYGYETESTYYGAHIGVGQIFELSENTDLDVYGKFFHTYVDGDTVTIGNDVFDFDSITSDRLRVGARVTKQQAKVNTYYGLAYEYEFNGDADMKAAGIKADTQSFGGGTGIAELGFNYQPGTDSPWNFDLNLRGYVGERQGGSFNVQATYTF